VCKDLEGLCAERRARDAEGLVLLPKATIGALEQKTGAKRSPQQPDPDKKTREDDAGFFRRGSAQKGKELFSRGNYLNHQKNLGM